LSANDERHWFQSLSLCEAEKLGRPRVLPLGPMLNKFSRHRAFCADYQMGKIIRNLVMAEKHADSLSRGGKRPNPKGRA
jgi:hypothetical protein